MTAVASGSTGCVAAENAVLTNNFDQWPSIEERPEEHSGMFGDAICHLIETDLKLQTLLSSSSLFGTCTKR